MKKVLTERPRAGGFRSYKDVRTRENRGDIEDLPTKQGMRRPYTNEPKSLTDLLGPLVRFLRSSVGRPWNDVWSEICAQLSSNTVDNHLKLHVMLEVEVNTVLIDGKVYVCSRYAGYVEPLHNLYVHPVTGLLCATECKTAPWKAERRKIENHDGLSYIVRDDGVLMPHTNYNWRSPRHVGIHPRFIIGPEKEAVWIGGIWYWVVFEDVPPRPKTLVGVPIIPLRTDFVTGEVKETGRFRARKLQMSHDDLKRYGLVNT